jgi:hypothetical protein
VVVETKVEPCDYSSSVLPYPDVGLGVLEVGEAFAVMAAAVVADAVGEQVDNVCYECMNVHRTGSVDGVCSFVIQGRRLERSNRLERLQGCPVVVPSFVGCLEKAQEEVRRRLVQGT